MNLHGIVAGVVGAINPLIPVTVRVSVGSEQNADGSGNRDPVYATPGAITASIAGNVLTVTAVAAGVLQPGQTLSGSGVEPGTMITAYGSGSGGAGTYEVNRAQTVPSTAMTTVYTIQAQVQPMTYRDLMMTEGLNMNGARRKIYQNGRIDGVIRPLLKGGDLVEIATGGVDDGEWLVVQSLEQFPDWVSAAMTMQNQ